jgi:polyketide synthase Type III
VNHSRILGIGTANPPVRLTQEQSFHAAGYQGERIRKIFLNSDIDHRHFYLEGTLNRGESSDQLNQRFLRGAMKTGCRAILNCVKAAGITVQDVDFLAVCTCTGYVCPDIGSRLIAHMGFINNLQRASIGPWVCGCPSYDAAGSRFRSRQSGPTSTNASRRDLLSLLLRR